MNRPPRTAGHAQLQTLVKQFADAGLTPVVSTNGSIPGADIQVAKGPKPGEVVEARLTTKGSRRIEVATMPAPREPQSVRIESA